jgi:hypothetical protein
LWTVDVWFKSTVMKWTIRGCVECFGKLSNLSLSERLQETRQRRDILKLLYKVKKKNLKRRSCKVRVLNFTLDKSLFKTTFDSSNLDFFFIRFVVDEFPSCCRVLKRFFHKNRYSVLFKKKNWLLTILCLSDWVFFLYRIDGIKLRDSG